jgi:hypothetical protein
MPSSNFFASLDKRLDSNARRVPVWLAFEGCKKCALLGVRPVRQPVDATVQALLHSMGFLMLILCLERPFTQPSLNDSNPLLISEDNEGKDILLGLTMPHNNNLASQKPSK